MINEGKLRRLQKGAWVVAAVSLGVFLVLIALSASRLNTLQRQVADTEQDLLQKSRDLQTKTEEVQAKTEEIQAKQAELEDIDGKLTLLRELYAKMAEENPGLARSATASVLAADPQAAEILPRVYIHIRNEGQRERAATLGQALQRAGFVVPGIERLVDVGPRNSELRYFRAAETEEADAELAAAVLRAAGLPLDPKFVAGFEDSPQVRARHYELWLAPDF